MARAKRTVRTDARRRYRAELVGATAEATDEPTTDTSAYPAGSAAVNERRRGTAPGASGSPSAASGPRPARPGFASSARAAYRPPNVREDLAALPRLLVHWSVLVSVALMVVGTVLILAGGTQTDANGVVTETATGSIGAMLVPLFVQPPAFGAALLVGFMLPRATWLVGLLFGLLASACYTTIVLAVPLTPEQAAQLPAGLIQIWTLGAIGTMFFASGIAWYRRFLDLLNPNRGARARPQAKAGQKPVAGRGNAPRNRLSGSGR